MQIVINISEEDYKRLQRKDKFDDIALNYYEKLIVRGKVLEQESIDYKAQYDSFSKKAEIVISQLRSDRDRLLEVLDRIKAEIEQDAFKDVNGSKYIFVNRVNQIIDKYKAEVEPRESEENE